MLVLTPNEDADASAVLQKINAAPAGTKFDFPTSFFRGRSVQPRLARWLYEEARNGILAATLKPLGKKNSDGYEKR